MQVSGETAVIVVKEPKEDSEVSIQLRRHSSWKADSRSGKSLAAAV